MGSQVTTKRGDTGTTVLISGERESKSHPILECCGQLDTLRAGTALCRQSLLAMKDPQSQSAAGFLNWLIHALFLVGSQCNDPLNRHPEYRHRDLTQADLDRLEEYQAAFESEVKLPRSFIASATNRVSAELDLLCTQVRTFERSLIRLKEAVPDFQAETLVAFTNRLSDSIYMLARFMERGEYAPVDYGVLDTDG